MSDAYYVYDGYVIGIIAKSDKEGATYHINPYSAEIFLYIPWRLKGFFRLNHQKCFSLLFLFHLNTYVMSLRPL